MITEWLFEVHHHLISTCTPPLTLSWNQQDISTVSEIKLREKPFFLIGKHPDICDIML
jgi:hypothetical protein